MSIVPTPPNITLLPVLRAVSTGLSIIGSVSAGLFYLGHLLYAFADTQVRLQESVVLLGEKLESGMKTRQDELNAVIGQMAEQNKILVHIQRNATDVAVSQATTANEVANLKETVVEVKKIVSGHTEDISVTRHNTTPPSMR